MVSLEKIQEYYIQGFININKHPFTELYVINYSKRASMEAIWDELTLNFRGLIINKQGKIISRPFRKFFELDQLPQELIPRDNPLEVYEKLDGTMGIMYWNQNKPYIATRGSFVSYQATKATEILYTKYSEIFRFLNPSFTYLFEIILPENRIAIDYGSTSDLFLIGIINTETGEEYNVYSFPELNFPRPKIIETFNIQEFINKNEKNIEGFVLKYVNDFRVKIKSKSYTSQSQFISNLKEYIVYKTICNRQSLYWEKKLYKIDNQWFKCILSEVIKMSEYYRDLTILSNTSNVEIDSLHIEARYINNRIQRNQFQIDILLHKLNYY
jgi:RNA ligase